MSAWLISLEGTEAGSRLAVALALMAALSHAMLGALQKGRYDPWISRGAIDFCYSLIALPVALFLVPWPEPYMWPIFAGAFVIHLTYKMLQAKTYTLGAYTIVYPVVRGTGPLFAIIGAGIIFGERFNLVQWLGVGVLLAGIYGFTAHSLKFTLVNRENLRLALSFAVITGFTVAIYTTYDAYGIRATADPFTFLAWFFVFDGIGMPIFALRRWRAMATKPALGPLLAQSIFGAVLVYLSFGAVMLATRLDNVGQAAVLRETSTLFAALIGWLVLKESVGPRRLMLMALIAAGAVIVEIGG